MAGFDETWIRIERLAGEAFELQSGKRFTYTFERGIVQPSTAKLRLPIMAFERAAQLMPANGPRDLDDLAGAPYLFAILSDPRIRP